MNMRLRLLRLVQYLAFALYFVLDSLKLFKVSYFDKLFIRIYFFYKSRLENFKLESISDLIKDDFTIIDVGANIGWFTVNVSKFLSSNGLVIAVEPEEINSRRFHDAIKMFKVQPRIRFEKCALTDKLGIGYLALDSKNPANHQLSRGDSSGGERIVLKTLDSLVVDETEISLIKIDVQGHELEVLVGATLTIQKYSPIFIVEIDNQGDSSTAPSVWAFLANLGYKCIDPVSRIPLSLEELSQRQGYFDVMFMPEPSRI